MLDFEFEVLQSFKQRISLYAKHTGMMEEGFFSVIVVIWYSFSKICHLYMNSHSSAKRLLNTHHQVYKKPKVQMHIAWEFLN